mgnify:CR=1 FL=1
MDITTYNRCRICIKETCGGTHNCHCSTCDKLDECPKILRATIRITNKCTQECAHCCFRSSPKSKIMMTIEMAEKIAKFIKSNNIFGLNLMGGEFFCNPNWYEIFDLFFDAAEHIRVVSNSDWIHSEDVKSKLLLLHNKYGNKFYICLSKDKWHTNKYVDEAEEWLNSVGIICRNGEGQMTDDSIVPVGRGEFHYGFYSFMGAYCLNPENEYTFLIDEEGKIYKCVFGTWKYATVDDYIDGGFEERFKDYQQRCSKIFIANCGSCRRCAESLSGTSEANGEEIVVKCE